MAEREFYRRFTMPGWYVYQEAEETEGFFTIKVSRELEPMLSDLHPVEGEVVLIEVVVEQRVPPLLIDEFNALTGRGDDDEHAAFAVDHGPGGGNSGDVPHPSPTTRPTWPGSDRGSR